MEYIMQDNLNKYLTEIEFLHQQQLYRKPITYIPISATKVLKDNEEFLMMASNNYLGLTHHPQVKKAAIDYFEYIAGCLHRYASQQAKQKGEYFVHGFTLAITAQNPFYRPVSEKDSQEGYVDLFLHPLLDIYKDISHSYIIELKYAKGKDSSERIEQLRRQAIEQAERYASSESVQKAIGPTMLHKIIIVYRGMEMVVCEEL